MPADGVLDKLVKTDAGLYDPRAERWFDLPLLAERARAANLRLVLVFGSQTSGLMHEESDLDVAIWPARPERCDDWEIRGDLTNLLAEVCKIDLDHVHLVVVPSESSSLMMEILRGHVVAYSRSDRDYFEFHLMVWNAYEDDWFYRKQRSRYVHAESSGT